LAVLSAGLGYAFDFVAFGDACAFDVVVSCKDKFVCDGFWYAARVVCAGAACAFSEVSKCHVYSPLRRQVYAEVVDGSAVAEACGVFCWRAVFHGLNEDFHGVFSGAQVDYFERLFYEVGGAGFFAGVFAWAHEAVYEAFYDVDAGFAEALVFVASHAVGQGHGRQVYVAL